MGALKSLNIFEAPLFHKGASYISKYLHNPRNFNNIPRKLIHILRIWHQYSPKFVSHILHFQVKWLRNIKTIELYPEFIDIPRKQVIPINSWCHKEKIHRKHVIFIIFTIIQMSLSFRFICCWYVNSDFNIYYVVDTSHQFKKCFVYLLIVIRNKSIFIGITFGIEKYLTLWFIQATQVMCS